MAAQRCAEHCQGPLVMGTFGRSKSLVARPRRLTLRVAQPGQVQAPKQRAVKLVLQQPAAAAPRDSLTPCAGLVDCCGGVTGRTTDSSAATVTAAYWMAARVLPGRRVDHDPQGWRHRRADKESFNRDRGVRDLRGAVHLMWARRALTVGLWHPRRAAGIVLRVHKAKREI